MCNQDLAFILVLNTAGGIHLGYPLKITALVEISREVCNVQTLHATKRGLISVLDLVW